MIGAEIPDADAAQCAILLQIKTQTHAAIELILHPQREATGIEGARTGARKRLRKLPVAKCAIAIHARETGAAGHVEFFKYRRASFDIQSVAA